MPLGYLEESMPLTVLTSLIHVVMFVYSKHAIYAYTKRQTMHEHSVKAG